MNDYNVYGNGDIEIVLVHGGPGARGSMSDLGLMLSKYASVLEINQSKLSIDELIEEMKTYIDKFCNKKVVLLGHSWGAWLVCLYAAQYPDDIRKIIMVGSGSFEEKYVREFNEVRMNRLSNEEKVYYQELMKNFTSDDLTIKDDVMMRFGKLMSKIDTFEFSGNDSDDSGKASFEMFNAIWSEASEMRKSGMLLNKVKDLTVPVHIIQGDYDSHSIKGILEPFNGKGIEYTYDLLENCGHYPWREKYAKDKFLEIVKREITKKR